MIVEREKLLSGLNIMDRILALGAGKMPRMVKLEVASNNILLTASGPKVFGKSSVPCDNDGTDFEAIVPLTQFMAVAQAANVDTLEVNYKPEHLELRAGKFQTNLKYVSADAYHIAPLREQIGLHSVDARQLLTALQAVRYAVATEYFRANYTGVLVNFTGENLIAVATDGYRLCEYTQPCAIPAMRMLIEAKAVDLILRVFTKDAGQLQLGIVENALVIVGSAHTLNVPLLEDGYPEYRRAIPTHTEYFEVGIKEALETMKRVRVFADKQNDAVRISINEGLATFTASGDYGDAEESIEIRSTAPFDFYINSRYFVEAIENCDASSLRVYFGEPHKIIVFQQGGYLAAAALLRMEGKYETGGNNHVQQTG